MLLALLALSLLAIGLVLPASLEAVRSRRTARGRRRASRSGRSLSRRSGERLTLADPGRERRAEQRARELLRSCVNEEEWAMYRDLGFIRVFGRSPNGTGAEDPSADGDAGRATPPPSGESPREPASHRYAYLVYPHKPIMAYEPSSRRLLSEYCVEFSDLSGAVTGSRLPDSDDVLAKWMALTGDERRLLRDANMHLPGRQLDPARVRRDLWRLGEWERRRRRSAQAPR